MFLAIDIGNSNITIGVFDNDKIKFVSRISTDRSKTPDQYAIEIDNILNLYGTLPKEIDNSAISSVVPELTDEIGKAVNIITGRSPLIINSEIETDMKILIDDPNQLGADLYAGCYGAAKLYPLPCIVIDLGTASKISIIDKNCNFRGCAIAPGIKISLEALSAKTSQLPNISLKKPLHSIGTNTTDSMQSGVVYGFSSMLDGLIERFEKELDEGECFCVATGGLAGDLVTSCKRKIVYNRELILCGIKSISDKITADKF